MDADQLKHHIDRCVGLADQRDRDAIMRGFEALRADRDALRSVNESVRVCPAHTGEIVKGDTLCVICDLENAWAGRDRAREALHVAEENSRVWLRQLDRAEADRDALLDALANVLPYVTSPAGPARGMEKVGEAREVLARVRAGLEEGCDNGLGSGATGGPTGPTDSTVPDLRRRISTDASLAGEGGAALPIVHPDSCHSWHGDECDCGAAPAHETTIVRVRGWFEAHCSCDWQAAATLSRRVAEMDARHHVETTAAVPVPKEET